MPGFSFSLLRCRGSKDEAWTDRTPCEMKTKRQCGTKEEQEGVSQKSMKTKIPVVPHKAVAEVSKMGNL